MILLLLYLEGDRLLSVSLHLPAILNCRFPLRPFLNNTDRFILHPIAVVGKRFYIADISFLVHYKLYPNSVATCGCAVFRCHIPAKISLQEFFPRSLTTRERRFHFYLFENFIFIIFFFLFDHLLTLVDLCRCRNLLILYTFLILYVDLFFIKLFILLYNLLYFFILHDLGGSEFSHLNLRRWRWFRRRRGRNVLLLFFFFDLLQGHFLDI